jgi:hypothetical protein
MEHESSILHSQETTTEPYLKQVNQVHNLTPYIFKTSFNIILPPTTRSLKYPLPFMVSA